MKLEIEVNKTTIYFVKETAFYSRASKSNYVEIVIRGWEKAAIFIKSIMKETTLCS